MHFVVEDYKQNIFNARPEVGNSTRNVSETKRKFSMMKFNMGGDIPYSSMRADPVYSKFQSFVDKYAKEKPNFSRSFFSPQAQKQPKLEDCQTDSNLESLRPRI